MHYIIAMVEATGIELLFNRSCKVQILPLTIYGLGDRHTHVHMHTYLHKSDSQETKHMAGLRLVLKLAIYDVVL